MTKLPKRLLSEYEKAELEEEKRRKLEEKIKKEEEDKQKKLAEKMKKDEEKQKKLAEKMKKDEEKQKKLAEKMKKDEEKQKKLLDKQRQKKDLSDDEIKLNVINESIVEIIEKRIEYEPKCELLLNTDIIIEKIIHIADIHIRLSNSHTEYNSVFERFYDELRLKPKNSIVCLCGDLLHSKDELKPDTIITTWNFLKNISEILPLIIISGNHDTIEHNEDKIDSIMSILKDRPIDNIYYLRSSGVYMYNNIIFGVSSIMDKYLLKNEKLEELLDRSKLEKYNSNIKKIGLYHGAVGNALMNDIGIRLKGDRCIEDFNGYDYVLLGDIHKYQYLNESRTIAYSSSLISQNFSETDIYHGYLEWDILKGVSEYHILENEYAYHKIDIERLILEDINRLDNKLIESELKDVKKGHLRLEYNEKYDEIIKKDIIKRDINRIYPLITLSWKIIFDSDKFNCSRIKANYDSLEDVSEEDQESEDSSKETNNKEIDNLIVKYIRTKLGITDENLIKNMMELLKERIRESESNKKIEYVNSDWRILWLSFDYMYGYGPSNVIDFTKYPNNEIIGIFGDNAIGKSSIIDIITYMLYTRSARDDNSSNPKDIINIKSHKSEGTIILESRNIKYMITRKCYRASKKNNTIEQRMEMFKLILKKNLNEQELNQYKDNREVRLFEEDYKIITLTEKDRYKTVEELEQVIGTYDNFITTSVLLQSNNKTFRNKSNREKKDYLCQILKIDHFSNCEKSVSEKYKSLKQQLLNVKRIKDSITDERLEDLKKELEELELKMISYRDELNKETDLSEEINKKLEELQKSIIVNNSEIKDEEGLKKIMKIKLENENTINILKEELNNDRIRILKLEEKLNNLTLLERSEEILDKYNNLIDQQTKEKQEIMLNIQLLNDSKMSHNIIDLDKSYTVDNQNKEQMRLKEEIEKNKKELEGIIQKIEKSKKKIKSLKMLSKKEDIIKKNREYQEKIRKQRETINDKLNKLYSKKSDKIVELDKSYTIENQQNEEERLSEEIKKSEIELQDILKYIEKNKEKIKKLKLLSKKEDIIKKNKEYQEDNRKKRDIINDKLNELYSKKSDKIVELDKSYTMENQRIEQQRLSEEIKKNKIELHKILEDIDKNREAINNLKTILKREEIIKKNKEYQEENRKRIDIINDKLNELYSKKSDNIVELNNSYTIENQRTEKEKLKEDINKSKIELQEISKEIDKNREKINNLKILSERETIIKKNKEYQEENRKRRDIINDKLNKMYSKKSDIIESSEELNKELVELNTYLADKNIKGILEKREEIISNYNKFKESSIEELFKMLIELRDIKLKEIDETYYKNKIELIIDILNEILERGSDNITIRVYNEYMSLESEYKKKEDRNNKIREILEKIIINKNIDKDIQILKQELEEDEIISLNTDEYEELEKEETRKREYNDLISRLKLEELMKIKEIDMLESNKYKIEENITILLSNEEKIKMNGKIDKDIQRLKLELEEIRISLNTEDYEELERENIKEREYNESISRLKLEELNKTKDIDRLENSKLKVEEIIMIISSNEKKLLLHKKIEKEINKLKQELEENNNQSLNTENYEDLEREELKERGLNETISQLKLDEFKKSKEIDTLSNSREKVEENIKILKSNEEKLILYKKLEKEIKKLKQELEDNNVLSSNTEDYEELEKDELKEREYNETISGLKLEELKKSKEIELLEKNIEKIEENIKVLKLNEHNLIILQLLDEKIQRARNKMDNLEENNDKNEIVQEYKNLEREEREKLSIEKEKSDLNGLIMLNELKNNSLLKENDSIDQKILMYRSYKDDEIINNNIRGEIEVSKIYLNDINKRIKELDGLIIKGENKIESDIDKINKLERYTKEESKLETDNKIYGYLNKLVSSDGIQLYLLSAYLTTISNKINSILEPFIEKKIELVFNNEKTIDIKIIKGETVIHTLSGMESFMLDIVLKIIIGQISMIPKSNIMFIDESISVLDKNRLAAIEDLFVFLKQYYNQVYIITHMKQVKNSINYTLDIKRLRGYSLLRNIDNGLVIETSKKDISEEVLDV
jgi:DNA repair exonuclease SbcCD ATPase subunit